MRDRGLVAAPLRPAAGPLSWRLAFALYGLGFLALSWPYWSGLYTIPWDAKAHWLPHLQFLARAIHAGEWPAWTPHLFSGSPEIADPQSAVFSPLFLIVAALDPAPGVQSTDLVAFMAVLIAGLATLLIFRDRGWHPLGALVAALTLSFGASMSWRIQHIGQVISLAFFMLTLLLLARALDRRSILYGALSGAAGAALLIGRDQVALLSAYALALYVLDHWLRAGWRGTVLPLAAGTLVGALLIAVPITLTLLLAGLSNRAVIDYPNAVGGSLHPALLITAVVANLYGAAGPIAEHWGPPSPTWAGTGLALARNMGQLYYGIVPLLALIAALLSGKLWSREVRIFAILLALMVIYALGRYTPVFQLFYGYLPGVALYRRPADATFLIGALAAILSGYAIHRMATDWRPARSARIATVALLGTTVVAAVAIALRFDKLPLAAAHIAIAAHCVGIGAILFLWFAARPRARAAMAALLAFLLADLALNNAPSESTALPPAEFAILEPNTTNPTIRLLKEKIAAGTTETMRPRIEIAGIGFAWANAPLSQGIEQTLGNNPVRLKSYTEAIGAEDVTAVPEQRRFTPLFPSYESPLARLLGLTYVVSTKPIEAIDRTLPPGSRKPVAETADGLVYELSAPYPRVIFAGAQRQADFAAMIANGIWPEADLATTVLLEAPEPPAGPPPAAGTVRILRYGSAEVIVESRSDGPGFVVLNDIWHPWWRAEIDGAPAEVLKANVLFRAVRVPAGRHRVRFVFRPFVGAWEELFGRL